MYVKPVVSLRRRCSSVPARSTDDVRAEGRDRKAQRRHRACRTSRACRRRELRTERAGGIRIGLQLREVLREQPRIEREAGDAQRAPSA